MINWFLLSSDETFLSWWESSLPGRTLPLYSASEDTEWLEGDINDGNKMLWYSWPVIDRFLTPTVVCYTAFSIFIINTSIKGAVFRKPISRP